MARISTREFIGTRGRLHRMADGVIINGWVENVFGNQIEVRTSDDVFVDIGEMFRFELHGPKISAVFEASVAGVEQYDSGSSGVSYAIEGSSARVIEAEWVTIRFTIQGQFRFANAIKAFRVQVKDIKVVFKLNGTTVPGELIDVGEFGFGALIGQEIMPGTKLIADIGTTLGNVTANAAIRYCGPAKDGLYRIGLELQEMGRLDRPRWKRYISEIGA